MTCTAKIILIVIVVIVFNTIHAILRELKQLNKNK